MIFNFVDSPSHYRLLQDACADVGIPALGRLPNNPAPADPLFLGPGVLASYSHFYWGEDPAAIYSWLG